MIFSFTGTNFEAALRGAEAAFTTLGTESGNGNLIFLSDGEVNRGGSFDGEVVSLQDKGVNLSAFGVGQDASLESLQTIDPEAKVFTSTDELLSVFANVGNSDNNNSTNNNSNSIKRSNNIEKKASTPLKLKKKKKKKRRETSREFIFNMTDDGKKINYTILRKKNNRKSKYSK